MSEVQIIVERWVHIRQDLRLFLCLGLDDLAIAQYCNVPRCLNKPKMHKTLCFENIKFNRVFFKLVIKNNISRR